MIERTGVKDIVLIHLEDKPFSFARIEDIRDDWKKGWYHVTLLFFQVPLQVVTWILRDSYIDGVEFTMDGNRVRLEKVVAPEIELPSPEPDSPKVEKKDPPQKKDVGKIISFEKRKK
ncbi:MAG: hypothetical protein WC799_02580 [Desulfobacteraceae bacterium]|jgi:hypothetical protein